MTQKNYLLVSGAFFGVATLGQLTRLLGQIPVQIGTWNIPVWPSAFGMIFAAFMCVWAFRSVSK